MRQQFLIAEAAPPWTGPILSTAEDVSSAAGGEVRGNPIKLGLARISAAARGERESFRAVSRESFPAGPARGVHPASDPKCLNKFFLGGAPCPSVVVIYPGK